MKITAEIKLLNQGCEAIGLSPAQQVAASHAVAEAAGIALAFEKNISKGHRSAMFAHLAHLIARDGEDATRDFIATLGGMVGCKTAPLLIEEPFEDPTNWDEVQLR